MTGNIWHNRHMKRFYAILVLLMLVVPLLSSCVPSSFSCSSAPEPTPVYTGPCHADFYADSTRREGRGYVNFTSTSIGNIKTYRWDFGTGRTGVGAKAAEYYINDGYYTVTLTIEGPDCHDVCTKVDYIEVSGC